MKSNYLLIAVFLFAACGDSSQSWLSDYSQVKCAYITTQEQKEKDKSESVRKLLEEKQQQDKGLSAAAESYTKEISEIRAKIKKTERSYHTEYRKLTDKHNDKYGHVSTPGYEKAVERLKARQSKAIEDLQNKLEAVEADMKNDTAVKKITARLAELDEEIKHAEASVEAMYKPKVDSLQRILDELNSKAKYIQADLKGKELSKFNEARDSLKVYPCNYKYE